MSSESSRFDSDALNFPFAFGQPELTALFKLQPEDFFVEEKLGFELAEAGEHVFLFIEKRGMNTRFVHEQIAGLASVEEKDVSYAGLKDKQAVTRQWFSIYLPKGEEPDWYTLQGDEVRVLEVKRHNKKLRQGDHQRNFFRIRLRELEGEQPIWEKRLKDISSQGFPNYFGEQRFGHNGQNLIDAEALINTVHANRENDSKKRRGKRQVKQKGFKQRLQVSAARAWLFNQVLGGRVKQGSWHRSLEGDTNPPSGCMWGRGRLPVSGAVEEMEQELVGDYQKWADFLEHCGLQQERRNLQAIPYDFNYRFEANDLLLEFSLGTGEYATSLLRELCQFRAPVV